MLLQALPPWTTTPPAVVHSKDHRSGNHLAVLREVADTAPAQGAPLCLQGERPALVQRAGARATLSSATNRLCKDGGFTTLVRPPTHPPQMAPRARPVTPHDVVLLRLGSHHAAATPVQPSVSKSDLAAIHMRGKLKMKKKKSMLQQPTSTS